MKGGKRVGAGRPRVIDQLPLKSVRVPLGMESLVKEVIKIHRGKSEDWTVLLSFVLLGKLIGFPEDHAMKLSRSFRMEGIRRIDNQIKGFRSTSSLGLKLHPRTLKRIAELEQARELFKGAFPDVDSDILTDF